MSFTSVSHERVPGPRRGRVMTGWGALLLALSTGCTGVLDDDSSSRTGAGGSASAGSGPGTAGSSGVGLGPTSTGGVQLRLLTRAEYRSSLEALLGKLSVDLSLPDDTSVAGFIAVGASRVSVNSSAVEAYEASSRAATAEVFADQPRWQQLVGCQPQADLSDACVSSYVQSFGRRAFRRDLSEAELQEWTQVARNGAKLAASAKEGLAAVTSGMLQAPSFLYRVETNKLDAASGRLKYDGRSMATRLAFLLTGGPPSEGLVAAASSGQLDTAEGIRSASAPLLTSADATARMAAFFEEFAQAQQVLKVQKSSQLFPSFDAKLQASMLQGTQLFIKNVVLAPSGDMRAFFNSDQTFADALLAPIYGVTAPASGFSQVRLPADSGRAGILGQAAVIAGQSQPDRSSPTRRGVFILQNLLCQTPPQPPDGVITSLPADASLTARQKLEAHRTAPSCAACHALFDPLGVALEHLDAVGRYRATEEGLTIDATGTLDGVAFNGGAELGSALAGSARAMACVLRSFYRDANGRTDDDVEASEIDKLAQSLAAHNYVWKELVGDFVTSEAFRSAPALPLMTESP